MMLNEKKILIVDDDEFFLRVMSRLLDLEGYFVRTAPTVADGLDCFHFDPPDLVITDCCFPETTGLALVRAIRAINPAIPILVLTAYGECGNYLEYMNAGASDYYSKPVTSDVLMKKIRFYLEPSVVRKGALQTQEMEDRTDAGRKP